MANTDLNRRHFGKVLVLLIVLSTVACLALVEWSLKPEDGRYSADTRSSGGAPARHLQLREWKRNTNYRMVPPPGRQHHGQDEAKPVYDLKIDRDGFIEPAAVHEDADASIVFFGGSTTECMFVLPENRFPHLSARILGQQLGVKINGYNAGRSGNNTMHSLLLMLGKVLPRRPDVVVLMHATNDLGVLTSGGGYWAVSDGRRLIENETFSVNRAMRTAINATIPNTSNTLRRGLRRLRRLLSGSRANAAGAMNENDALSLPDVAGRRDFVSALTSFVEVAKAWGITTVLMTQVNVRARTKEERTDDFLAREQLGGDVGNRKEFKDEHDAYNEIVRQIAKQTDTQLIDLAAAKQWVYGDVYDGQHFTDSGSRIVAELVAKGLEDTIRGKLGR